MSWLDSILILVILLLLFYINRLRKEVKSYQTTWDEIEKVSDINGDGDVVVHVRHFPDEEKANKDE